MSLFNQLETDFKQAMLAQDRQTTNVLRLLKATLKNELIKLKKDKLSDEEIIKILRHELKKRQDSIEQFTQGQRLDLVAQEQAELKIIEKYLPAQMPLPEIKKIVAEVIGAMGQVTPNQFGQIMGAVMQKINGQADGKLVSQVVKEALRN